MLNRQPVVLIIAKNQNLLDQLAQDLKAHSFSPFGATTIKEGMPSLDVLQPDVVIIDLTSEEGFALLDELQLHRKSIGLVAIAESEAAVQRAREMGIDEIVMGDDLSAVVDAVALLVREGPVSPLKTDGTRILVVDDEPAILDIMSEALSRRGYSVATASSGKEALEIARQDAGLSLVLLDVILPEMGGIETLKELRRRHPHLLVIMISAMMDAEIAHHAVKLGAFDYILKPIDLRDLEDRLIACFASQEYRHRPWWKRLTS